MQSVAATKIASSCRDKNRLQCKRAKTGSCTTGTILLSYGVSRNHKNVLDPDLADIMALASTSQIKSILKSAVVDLEEEMTEGREAGWASKIEPGLLLSSKSGSASLVKSDEAKIFVSHIRFN